MMSTGVSFLTMAALAMRASASPSPMPRATLDTAAWSSLVRAADLSSAAYTGCLGTAFDVTITKQIYDGTTNAKGYVGYSTEKKKISVVMKGSTTMKDIINDIDTTLVTPSLSGVTFPPTLIEKYPDYTLESTGHSLGGSLTYLSYVALASNFPDKLITSNAMAAFPIGPQAWADWAASFNGTLNRGNNEDDGVPNMYIEAPYDFVHYGTEYYSYGTEITCLECTGERDSSCSAGNGQYGVTAGHFYSFGVEMGATGCATLL
ncbi:hypothetical protein N7488_005255 [Penicillium malachiteum]|nr:hypothetical protein N7488_005255 [Penicillium malachiteum]